MTQITVKPKVQVAGSMSEEGSEWMGALMRPSITLSSGAIFIGAWMFLLSIINVSVGAYSQDTKVLWIGFLTNGEETYSNSLGFVIDDVVFAILSAIMIGLGVFGINNAREDGVKGWMFGLPNDRMVASLISTDGGVTRTLASWMIFVGLIFYLIWSGINTTWVDPGVYSVMIAFVSLGVGLHWVEDSKESS